MRSLPRSPSAARLLAIGVLALACAGCGKAAGSQQAEGNGNSPATSTTSSHSSTPTGTATGTGTVSSSTTQALPGTGKPAITLGDKNYTEQFVLGQLYLQALTAQGYNVTLNQNIGPTQITVQALNAGTLSLYPEYLNVFDSTVAGLRRSFRTEAGADVAAQRYAAAHGLTLLKPTPFSDTAGLAVTDAYAAENGLHTIGDLRRVAGQLTVGGPSQFQYGAPGLPILHRVYGVTPAAFKAMAIGDQYSALDNATVQAIDVNTTDGQLDSGNYTLLSDPREVFGFGNVVPVVSAKVLTEEGPAFRAILDNVDSYLTTEAMQKMNAAVDVAQQDPAAVAKQFLETHGLLTPNQY